MASRTHDLTQKFSGRETIQFGRAAGLHYFQWAPRPECRDIRGVRFGLLRGSRGLIQSPERLRSGSLSEGCTYT